MSETDAVRLMILGSGSSPGQPMPGCDCAVCRSRDPHDRRRRCSALYTGADGTTILVDTSPDLYEQAHLAPIGRLDAVIVTHAHADHLHGIDELRSLYRTWGHVVPMYAAPATLAEITRRFDYIFDGRPVTGGGKPRLDIRPLAGPTTVGGVRVEPLTLPHTPTTDTTGLVFDRRVGYVVDCHEIPPPALETLRGVPLLVLDMLRETPHPTHLVWERSRAYRALVGAKRTVYVHMGHEVGHASFSARLDSGERLGYDGMALAVDCTGEVRETSEHPWPRGNL